MQNVKSCGYWSRDLLFTSNMKMVEVSDFDLDEVVLKTTTKKHM